MPKLASVEMSDETHARYKELANKDTRSLRNYLSMLLERVLREMDANPKKSVEGD